MQEVVLGTLHRARLAPIVVSVTEHLMRAGRQLRRQRARVDHPLRHGAHQTLVRLVRLALHHHVPVVNLSWRRGRAHRWRWRWSDVAHAVRKHRALAAVVVVHRKLLARGVEQVGVRTAGERADATSNEAVQVRRGPLARRVVDLERVSKLWLRELRVARGRVLLGHAHARRVGHWQTVGVPVVLLARSPQAVHVLGWAGWRMEGRRRSRRQRRR